MPAHQSYISISISLFLILGVIVLHYLVHPRDPHVIAKSLQNILQQVFAKKTIFLIIFKG